MTYSTPQIVCVGDALATVAGDKMDHVNADINQSDPRKTLNAYEADE